MVLFQNDFIFLFQKVFIKWDEWRRASCVNWLYAHSNQTSRQFFYTIHVSSIESISDQVQFKSNSMYWWITDVKTSLILQIPFWSLTQNVSQCRCNHQKHVRRRSKGQSDESLTSLPPLRPLRQRTGVKTCACESCHILVNLLTGFHPSLSGWRDRLCHLVLPFQTRGYVLQHLTWLF